MRMERRTMRMRRKIKERENKTRACSCRARGNHRGRPGIVWRYWGVTVLSAVMRRQDPLSRPGALKGSLGGVVVPWSFTVINSKMAARREGKGSVSISLGDETKDHRTSPP